MQLENVRPSRGFTAVELLVTMSMIGLLTALGLPSFNEWLTNTRIRTTAETLQNSLRLAQAEAVRRNRQTVFALTNATPVLNVTAVANARNWMIQTVPAITGEAAEFVQGGTFNDAQVGVTVTGAAATCFNSIGRLVANPTPGVNVACTVAAGTLPQFSVTSTGSGAYRPLTVTVAVGGQVRMCDPNAVSTRADAC